MEVRATAKYIRMSPRKVRLVADVVRGMPVEQAMNAPVGGLLPDKALRLGGEFCVFFRGKNFESGAYRINKKLMRCI